ncbi:MAG TPA: FAD-dependent oxidoreductase [Stackebrandtia sp.]|jgi:NADH dehydrogenase FAD-containing subunit|uniref:FAD-dependent oxidoreductase n=1 Tax=Stackebrandtia sp. TaxID=2023065 RepID=UPI002D2D7439|nr:FAD-dependent oxidoreductase [Stackebrandtia sp.]HZE41011.1 FAD-dependent oxidoreductase [Stackebrandtia sp.]
MNATVIVVGGGYGGCTVAKALDDVAQVTLIDPKDAFVHNVASLRTIVDPSWADRMFLPYENLLDNGTVIQDRVVIVEDGIVGLVSGRRIQADFIVLAAGTTYPFPAKFDNTHATAAKMRIHRTSKYLAEADRVVLMGAGAVGLELAGEIASTWPDKWVTIMDPAPDILSAGFMPGFDRALQNEMRSRLREQLAELRIDLVLGTAPRTMLPTRPGELATFTTHTVSGIPVTGDIWFRCHGRQRVSRFLSGAARTKDGHITVTPELRVPGTRHLFAIGDPALTGAPDTAVVAIETGNVAAQNIRALLSGERKLTPYEPSQPIFIVPLGPKAGISYMPGTGLMGPDQTAEMKGNDLLVGQYAEMFGIPAA